MKAIMISDKAKWCALMMNGDKTKEIRKNKALANAIQKLIDENGYADIYVCCSKINKKHYHLIESIDTDTGKTGYEIDYYIGSGDYLDYCYEGKVAFKFRCYKLEEMVLPYTKFGTGEYVHSEAERKWQTPTMDEDEILKLSCLTELELYKYLVGKNKGSYAIYISDLEVFDKPKDLSQFYKYMDWAKRSEHMICMFHKCNVCKKCQLTKAPQNFCYIEVETDV